MDVADPHHQRVLELDRRNRQHHTSRHRSLLLHWLARRLRRAAAVEPGVLPPVESGQVAITWGGHASALVRYSRLSVLCDPVLARSVNGVKRELGPGLSLDALADVDLVLISHAAPDHLDLGTLARLSRAATVVVPPGCAARVSPLGFARLVELGVGSSLQHRTVEVVAEDAQHGQRSSPSVSYVVRGDGPTVYFCGASGYFPGFTDIGRRHLPDLALLPIAGYWPRSFRRWYMSPLDALYAFEDLRARVMVPIRYGTFALSYERVGDPERWLAELVAERHLERFVVRLGAGESRVFVPPGAAALESSRYEVDAERPVDRISGEPLAAGAHRGVPFPAERPVGGALEGAFVSELRARERGAPADRMAAERVAADRMAAERVAADRMAAERVAAELLASELLPEPPAPARRAELPAVEASIDPLATSTREMILRPERRGPSRDDRARAGGRRPVALPAPPPGPTDADPDAFTMPGGRAGVGRALGPPPPPRRAPAVIVDHDDETNVFDTGETRVRDDLPPRDERTVASSPPCDDEDAAATRSLDLDMPETDTETMPVPVPLPGRR